MPTRICRSCNQRTAYQPLRCDKAPTVCSCGGELVAEWNHHLTAARHLAAQERRLAFLRALERQAVSGRPNRHYTPERLANLMKLCVGRIRRMERVLNQREAG